MQALAEEGKARYEKVTFKVVDLVCLLFILVYGFFFCYVAIGLFIYLLNIFGMMNWMVLFTW